MRLTEALFRYKRALPGGHIWRGKYRLYRKVTPRDLLNLKLNFEREEQNMFYLRHPYLTQEQSHGHVSAQNKEKNFIASKIASQNWKSHCYIGDRFGFLKVTDSWE